MKIKIFKNGNLIKEHSAPKGLVVLGRAEDCDVCILDDAISRKHVEFRIIDENNVSFSRKSQFGEIFKDGVAVEEGKLSSGESIDIGDIKILVEADGADDKKATKEKASDFELFTMSADPTTLPELDKKVEPTQKEENNSDDDVKETPLKEEKIKDEKVEEQKTNSGTAKKDYFGDETMVGPSRLIYQMIAISGPYKDKVFPLEKESIMLGRSNKAEIVLIDDLISREHARIYRQGVESFIVDLNSANGVKVNGRKITEPVALNSGDILEIGASAFRYMAINPLVQSVKGVSELSSSKIKQAAVEKVVDLSETQVRNIEKSYGLEDENKKKKKKVILIAIIFLFVFILVFVLISSADEKKKAEEQALLEKQKKEQEEKLKEEVPEVKCLEEGLCHLPIDVQKQLQAEYDVGVKLFKNYQYELAEDRARQILEKSPDWAKAQELLRTASEAKEQLLIQKEQEEEAAVRKMLQEKVSKLLSTARDQMSKGKYDDLKLTLASIFEVDPNNNEAKQMADKLEQMEEDRKIAQEKRAKFLASLQTYKRIFADGKKLYERKEYVKAIETFQKCINMPNLNSPEVQEMRSESKRLMEESSRLLKESIAPELSVAEQALMSSQYREAIASYQRVLKMDYRNKTAKSGLEKAKTALNETAKDYFSRALISESVSDFKTACMYYNAVVETAIPGTRYYNLAMEKVRKRCEKSAGEK
ncbi:MAG TPA: FHA domain-containing protein [bacterium]|nr:FHA domain-containing protein [bacterium]